MSSEDTTNSGFTASETKLIMCMIKNLQGDFPVRPVLYVAAACADLSETNYDAVATELGCKDASVAKARWGQIKRKKIMPSGSTDGKKATPRKRKGAAVGSDGVTDESPAPKKRGRQTKTQKMEDGDAVDVKPEPIEDELDAVETTEDVAA